MAKLNIGKDFSFDPSGRFLTDSDSSGEQFREEVLKPQIEALSENEILEITLDDGVEGYGSSFLVEGFAGMVKYGYITSEKLISKLKFVYEDHDFEFYRDRIIDYINQSSYNSKSYPEQS